MSEDLRTIKQMIAEVNHAQLSGPGWYTKGANGLYQQVALWLKKGEEASSKIEEQLALKDKQLKELAEALIVNKTQKICPKCENDIQNGSHWMTCPYFDAYKLAQDLTNETSHEDK